MNRINTFVLFTIGKQIADLQSIGEANTGKELTYQDVFGYFLNVRISVNNLLNDDVFFLRTCRQAATKLIQAIDSVVPRDLNQAFNKDWASEVKAWDVSTVKEASKRFETVLAEELAILDSYCVAQKGVYSTYELIQNAERMFPAAAIAKLSDQTISDIRQAGKCLAFETPTAAAFHIIRAIESVFVQYYEKTLGTPPRTRMRNWGVYIKTLRESGKHDPKIVDFMEHIKDNYRNPISHPETLLSVDEVMVFFGVAVSAITQITNAL